jgi:hypothetical protein
MAVQAKAKGNSPATGMMKTPAPDEVTEVRNPKNGGSGYGMNNYRGASSVDPGQRVLSPLAQNLESSVDDDGVLQTIISRPRGALNEGVDDQTRKISPDQAVPTAFGMKPRASGGTIPAKIGGK